MAMNSSSTISDMKLRNRIVGVGRFRVEETAVGQADLQADHLAGQLDAGEQDANGEAQRRADQ